MPHYQPVSKLTAGLLLFPLALAVRVMAPPS